MTDMPCLKDSLMKITRSFSMNLLVFFIVFSAFPCFNFLDHQQLWASPNVQVLYKPKLDQAVYYYSPTDQAIQVLARVVGEYGERLSNVSVRLEHPCFETTTVQSDFDAVFMSKLLVKQALSDQCDRSIFTFLEQLSPVLQVTLPHINELNLNSDHLKQQIKDHPPVKKLIWLQPKENSSQQMDFKTLSVLELHFKVFVHQSIINSPSEFQHTFQAQPFQLEIKVHPASYLYRDDHIVLVNKLSLNHNFPKGLGVPFKKALKVKQLVNVVKTDPNESHDYKLTKAQHSQLKIDDELEFNTSVEALKTYRFSYEFNWWDLPPLKIHSYSLKLLPKFRLKHLELSQNFWRSKCSINGSIQAIGISQSTPRQIQYLQDLVTQKQIQLKAQWSIFDTDAKPNKIKTTINTDERTIPILNDGLWSQEFVLPRDQAVQINIELLTKTEKTQAWHRQGESYKSPLLVNYSRIFDLIILLGVYVIAFGLAYILWRVFAQQKTVLSSRQIKSKQGLTVARLSELNESFSEITAQTNYIICDALNRKLISGELTLISLDIFGTPQRWSDAFKQILTQSPLHFTTTFESINSLAKSKSEDLHFDLVPGQVFWVIAKHYEPLLFEVPQGVGTVVIPLWPCRFALTRIWNEIFVQLKISQSFGQGSLVKLQQEIEKQGDLALVTTFNILAQDLYDKREITHQQLLNTLETLDEVLTRLQISRSLLYPPSDFQRIIKL